MFCRPVQSKQIIIYQNPCLEQNSSPTPTEISLISILVYVVDEDDKFDAGMTKILPSLYKGSPNFPVRVSSQRKQRKKGVANQNYGYDEHQQKSMITFTSACENVICLINLDLTLTIRFIHHSRVIFGYCSRHFYETLLLH